jgi:hypothetical protein
MMKGREMFPETLAITNQLTWLIARLDLMGATVQIWCRNRLKKDNVVCRDSFWLRHEVFFEKLIVNDLKKFDAFYTTRKFIAVFTNTQY